MYMNFTTIITLDLSHSPVSECECECVCLYVCVSNHSIFAWGYLPFSEV